jgi:hypothetical protein
MKRSLVLPFLLLLGGAAGCGEAIDGDGNPDAGGGGGVQPTFTSLYGDYFSNCAQCHSPGGAGRTEDIEKTLDFTSKQTAYTTLQGMASGMTGNFMDCNGVPFLDAAPARSLLLASIHQPTRQAFDHPSHPNCDADTISDQTLKVGSSPSPAFIAALQMWLMAGAPNN